MNRLQWTVRGLVVAVVLGLASAAFAVGRTALTVTAAGGGYNYAGIAVTMTAADASNKNSFIATGKELVIAQNTDASSHTVTITSATDERGRTKDISAETIAAGAIRIYGPFPLAGWDQGGGIIYLEANDATVKFGVVKLP